MLNLDRFRIVLFILLGIAVIVFTGCEKKTESPETEKQAAEDSSSVITDSTKIEKSEIIDLTGTWKGTFDSRSTVLKITEQNGNKFSGKISIAYREAINQEVSGAIDTSSNSISMKDLLHSRYMGKYNGKISQDGTKISGTFTMNLDGKKFSFNLEKK